MSVSLVTVYGTSSLLQAKWQFSQCWRSQWHLICCHWIWKSSSINRANTMAHSEGKSTFLWTNSLSFAHKKLPDIWQSATLTQPMDAASTTYYILVWHTAILLEVHLQQYIYLLCMAITLPGTEQQTQPAAQTASVGQDATACLQEESKRWHLIKEQSTQHVGSMSNICLKWPVICHLTALHLCKFMVEWRIQEGW